MKMKFSQTQFLNLVNDLMTACHQVHQENLNIDLKFDDFNVKVKDKIKILNSMK